MIYLLNAGDSYEQHITYVAEGDGDIEPALVEYRQESAKHLKSWRQAEAIVMKRIGGQPQISRAATRQEDFDKWQAAARAWNTKFHAAMERHGYHPAPDLATVLVRHGFQIREHQIHRYAM